MRARTTFKLMLLIGLLAFLYGGYIFNESRWGKKWQPADAILPNNMRYFGELKNGLLEGPGELEGADGTRFKGHFLQGLMHGAGEQWGINYHFKGEFDRGLLAKGVLEFTTGRRYDGEFNNNRMHGQGKLELGDGSSFEGTFAEDAMVQGIFKDTFGGFYEGAFVKDLYHGPGVYVGENGDRYEGDFVEGMLTGKGRILLADGSRYAGDVKNWLSHGQGELTDAEGNSYRGGFEYGSYHGQGELTLKEAENGITTLKGEWQEGYLIDDPRNKRKSIRPTIEKILYSQNSLLERAADSLSSQAPDLIDLYFLGIAGDGEQEIFLKEMREAQSVLNANLLQPHRSLLLINNLQTVEEYPLATRISLQQAVKSIEQTMDVTQDVLLLFLTSHGSEDHRFSIQMPGIRLPSISQQNLAEVLNQSSIQWKVVIISACFSGGFIPSLQNDQTLVITAARHDRQSFGCDDKNDMTYFGRAYFKEALANNPDFIAAFEQAKTLVGQWEEQDFPDDDRSEPQIFVGEKIKAHLQTWAAQRQNQQMMGVPTSPEGP